MATVVEYCAVAGIISLGVLVSWPLLKKRHKNNADIAQQQVKQDMNGINLKQQPQTDLFVRAGTT